MSLDQKRAPILEALQNMKDSRLVPFDVPGHKRGKGNRELLNFLGEQCLEVDVNSMKPLDNLCHPSSVIREAQELAAEAFGAEHAFFMVGGTTSSVQAMILSVCKEGEKIILPRNVHRSVINALILNGAVPVYVDPKTNHELGISLGMSVADVQSAIERTPDAKAVLINNPTYYGVCSDLQAITDMAHARGMLVLVDEAHGTHFYFGENLPLNAMAACADFASVSMHKSGGSLTQSSILLTGKGVNPDYVRQVINLTQTTSASYLLLSSLDVSRRNLSLNGVNTFRRVSEMANYAREEINQIGCFYAFAKDIINGDSVFDFDETKLSVNTIGTGIAGIEVYDLLRDEYDIQIEFGDMSNVLAYISVGDREKDIERLISAFSEIKRRFSRQKMPAVVREYISPTVVLPPRVAFYADKNQMPIKEADGMVCTEFVMCYPPGIPIIAPGELVTKDIIEHIEYSKEKGCLVTGTEDMSVEYINVTR